MEGPLLWGSSSGRQSPVHGASGSRSSSPSGSRPASPAQASSSGASSSQKVLTREQAQEILTEGMGGVDKADVIKALEVVPAEQWGRFIEVAGDLTAGINRDVKAFVIKAIAKVPAEQRDAFVAVVQTLTEGMSELYKSLMIEVFSIVPEQLEDFLALNSVLIEKDISADNRARLLHALSKKNTKKGDVEIARELVGYENLRELLRKPGQLEPLMRVFNASEKEERRQILDNLISEFRRPCNAPGCQERDKREER